MQRTTPKVRKSSGKTLSDSDQIFPCALKELGCERTSLDTYVYIWDHPDYCVLSVLQTEVVNMVKQRTTFYKMEAPDSTAKIMFEVNISDKSTEESQQIYTLPVMPHSM